MTRTLSFIVLAHLLCVGCTGQIKDAQSEENTCGDGLLDPGEDCDTEVASTDSCVFRGYSGGSLTCSSDCTVDESRCLPADASTCGDALIEGLEQCEDGELGGQSCASLGYDDGTLTCSACRFGVSQCEGEGPACGDGVKQAIEDCDGADLGSRTCVSLGFHSGALGCTDDCTLDTRQCAACGNNQVEGSEECDSTEPIPCSTMGFDSGLASCSAQCTLDVSLCTGAGCGNGVLDDGEECEPSRPITTTCADLEGFNAGVLTCTAGCQIDASACSTCGNGSVDGGEACDGTDMGGATCASVSGGTFDGGTLICLETCDGFDTSTCERCGDGVVTAGEECEGTDGGGAACADLPDWDGGTLGCDPLTCRYDTSACTACGNGVVETGEACDGTEVGGLTCLDVGFDGGTLGCQASCAELDLSQCTTAVGEPAHMQGMTTAHNAVRAATGAGMPDLVWDDDIEAFAQEWADEVARRGCELVHRPRDGSEWTQRYGENGWKGFGTPDPQAVVDRWALEAQNYDYASNTCSSICGHYTQMVWATTLRLGCATASCGGTTVLFCNYDPPGNYQGMRPY